MLSNEEKAKVLHIEKIICEQLLDIDVPEIVFERHSNMKTATNKAMAEIHVDREPKIFIDDDMNFSPEIVLYIGHELRHIYQFYDLNMVKEFKNHRSSENLSTEEYNLQWLEVDANAFGAICMVEIAHCKPLWNGLTDKVKDAIEQRQRQIYKNEFYIGGIKS